MTATLIIGDVLDVLRSMPDDSVDMVMTSPPFLALRSYLPADHPDKAKEIGSEPTPGEFIDALLDVTRELARVVAPHGSICIELGDTYSGSGGAGGDYADDGMRKGQPKFKANPDRYRGYSGGGDGHATDDGTTRIVNSGGAGWPEAKSLCLIPELYRIALAYGINPLTGRQTPTWRVRNVVRWHRPNPPVGALVDKFRPATSDMVIACKARDRYFDLDAVRNPYSENTNARTARGVDSKQRTAKTSPDGNRDSLADRDNDGAGAPPLDTWIIPTHGYPGSHYATFPPALCIKPILAMCPERVCTECGEPSRRIVGEAEYVNARSGATVDKAAWRSDELNRQGAIGRDNGSLRVASTLGWTDCGHGSYRNGIVLDPFAGSGTTLSVATGHGRDAIGIDLDERNADLCRQRVGMFLDVRTHTPEAVA